MPAYTAEALAKLTLSQLKTLRENAFTRQASEIVALCEAELARRKPRKATKAKGVAAGSNIGPVHGFHFICPNELGVVHNSDGTFWTGIWAVREARLGPAIAAGAYVALHNSRTELSYRQGRLKAWRREERPGKAIPYGIVFLVASSDTPLPWRGDGAGEKGYWYGDTPTSA